MLKFQKSDKCPFCEYYVWYYIINIYLGGAYNWNYQHIAFGCKNIASDFTKQ